MIEAFADVVRIFISIMQSSKIEGTLFLLAVIVVTMFGLHLAGAIDVIWF